MIVITIKFMIFIILIAIDNIITIRFIFKSLKIVYVVG